MIKTTVYIEGMACSMCEAHVNEAIRKAFPDAKKVASSHSKNESTFLTETAIDEDALKAAIEQTGYTFVSSKSAPYEKKGLFGRR